MNEEEQILERIERAKLPISLFYALKDRIRDWKKGLITTSLLVYEIDACIKHRISN